MSGTVDDVDSTENRVVVKSCEEQPERKKRRLEASEPNIGLRCTMGDLLRAARDPFSPSPRPVATLKRMSGDFVVREIPLQCVAVDGSEARPLQLRSCEVPADCTDPNNVTTKAANAPGGAPSSCLTAEAATEAFQSIVAPADLAPFVLYAVTAAASPANRQERRARPADQSRQLAITEVKVHPVEDSKEGRTKIHHAVKSVLGPRFCSAAAEGGAVVVGLVSKPPQGVRRDWRNMTQRPAWPAGRGDYLQFTVMKENMDSTTMLRQLATKLGVSSRSLHFSGTKDKRGVTFQRVDGWRLQAERVAKLNEQSFGRSCTVRVGDFAYVAAPLSIGNLWGNHFTVVLRDVSWFALPDCDILARLDAWSRMIHQYGFINYYGPQRFGTTTVLTSDIGREVLRRNYRQAVLLILQSRAEIVPSFSRVVDLAAKGDWSAALAIAPHYCFMERDLLGHLTRQPSDFEGALALVPRPLGMLYCHSVQSLVWNEMVSARLRYCHNAVLPGDLVLIGGSSVVASEPEATVIEEDNLEESGQPLTAKEADGAVDADAIVQTTEPPPGDSAPEEAAARAGILPQVHRVTEADVASGVYSLSDVVLPVAGPDPDLVFPSDTHCCSRVAYDTMLESLGCADLLKASSHAVKRYHFHGTYRFIFTKPKNFQLRFHRYSDPLEPVVQLSDPALATPAAKSDGNADNHKRLAIVADFSLGAGSYATSLIRELCETRRGDENLDQNGSH